ncbi:hypothetical protein [Prochlorococcus marinus]|nr:hypothetical protein [Prochlorococcus marinus]MCH2566750.1 hypothetical protein [Prochlorococcus sp. ALOHA_A2.0_51]
MMWLSSLQMACIVNSYFKALVKGLFILLLLNRLYSVFAILFYNMGQR